MAYIADQLFPPVKENDWTGDDEYSSFNFWREPISEVEFEVDGVPTLNTSSTSGPPPSGEASSSNNTPPNGGSASVPAGALSTIPEN